MTPETNLNSPPSNLCRPPSNATPKRKRAPRAQPGPARAVTYSLPSERERLLLSLGHYERLNCAYHTLLTLAELYIGELLGRPGAHVSPDTRNTFGTPALWKLTANWMAADPAQYEAPRK